ncbi:MAG: SMC-Scp complex subunit ScpB [Phycisphaerales bacterium]
MSSSTPTDSHSVVESKESGLAPLNETPEDALSAERLAGPVEAILLSAERAVPGLRLAIALGLIPESMGQDEGEGAGTAAEPPPEGGESAVAGEAGGQAEGAAEAGEGAKPRAKKPRRKQPEAAAARRERALQGIRGAIESLNSAYEQTGRAFRIELLAGGYRVMTLPRYSWAIAAYQGSRAKTSLSPAGLEALAIIAYKQPITRAKLEAIRGVACGEILRTLLDRRLITITGRAEELGRPLLYGTSKRFLELFGLSSLKDLPSADELRNKG